MLRIRKEPEGLSELVEDGIGQQQALAVQRGIHLRAQMSRVTLPVLCDRGRVLQVLVNLVGNAIKFTQPGGSVSVRTSKHGKEARVAVSDTGPGISAEGLPRVFDRYWRAGETTAKGTGLGLYISRGIIEAHGGKIWVESTLGQGSTFTFSLPLATKSAHAGVAPPTAP
jgi:signal transduction histidine kinase